MQNPPPGPPPGGQPPSYPPPGGQPPSYPTAAGGLDKRTGAFLSYLLGWITGLIFLFVAKNDPDVKYHAAQSVVFFGSLTVIEILVDIVTGIVHPLWFLGFLNFFVSLFGFVMWIVCLVQAYSNNGARFQIPLVGSFVTPYAEQLAASVN
jgi:uncharacterized membrane protein